jgi:hypothetical protein
MFRKYNGFVSKARVSACMYFLVNAYSDMVLRLIVDCASKSGQDINISFSRVPSVITKEGN